MIVIPELQLNRFQAVKIPSARKLYEKFGFKESAGHPDNLDPYKFSTPKNTPSTPLSDIARGAYINDHFEAPQDVPEEVKEEIKDSEPVNNE